MAALEAHTYQLPALLTRECNLPESSEARVAIQIGAGAESIATGLRRLSAMSDEERIQISARGRKLADRKFNRAALAREMHEVIVESVRHRCCVKRTKASRCQEAAI